MPNLIGPNIRLKSVQLSISTTFSRKGTGDPKNQLCDSLEKMIPRKNGYDLLKPVHVYGYIDPTCVPEYKYKAHVSNC